MYLSSVFASGEWSYIYVQLRGSKYCRPFSSFNKDEFFSQFHDDCHLGTNIFGTPKIAALAEAEDIFLVMYLLAAVSYSNVKVSAISIGLLSAISIQKSSRSFSGWSVLLPTIIAAFTAPIDVPAAMSILIFFFTNALNTPQANAPREPPPCNTSTFSVFLDSLCLG